MESYVEEWIKYSKMDLEVSKRELYRDEDEEVILTPIVCFHCQQAVEKALKAYLIKHKVEFNKMHNLETLRKMCSEIDKNFQALDFGELNYYGVSTRYPDGLMGMPSFEKTKELYEISCKITDFIFGIFLALLYNRVYRENARCHKPSYSVLVAIIILVIALVTESFLLSPSLQLIAPLYWPLIAVLIIVASLPENGEVPFLNNRILVWLGKNSFTIFLVHRLVLRYTSKLVEFDNIIIYVVFCLVLTLVVTFLIDKFILIPITQWLTKKIQPSMTVQ